MLRHLRIAKVNELRRGAGQIGPRQGRNGAIAADRADLLRHVGEPHPAHEPGRGGAAALAEYASRHAADYGRIEMVIYENRNDSIGKRIDLMNDKLRDRIAKVKDHAHLRDIFDNP